MEKIAEITHGGLVLVCQRFTRKKKQLRNLIISKLRTTFPFTFTPYEK